MFELVLRAPRELVEPVSDTLIDRLDALSVSLSDADAGSADEQTLFGEPGMPPPDEAWAHSTLVALFADESLATAALSALRAQQGGAVQLQSLQALPDQDWVRLTQSQFAPVLVCEGFWVVPSWHEPPPQARHVIHLDPGLAFGTGTHPTTRMCLHWLARHEAVLAAGGTRVLDYGCGSGILAIGAALFGAVEVDAVDIDPAAVTASAHNARANRVTLNTGAPDLAQGRYGVVLANILATPLKLLAPLLAAHVADGGHLVLAGILQRQADELSAAYAPWLRLSVRDEQEGWILMTGQRAAVAA